MNLDFPSKNFQIYGEQNNNNLLIRGDNTIVLEILKEEFANKIKCIYIDPPYNNGEKYTHYNDNKASDVWLEGIKKVLLLLKPLLTKDGSIWISIDDNEMHYLKVAADNIFGRENFISTVVWQQRKSRENRRVFSVNHEYILVYSISPQDFKYSMNKLNFTPEVMARYKNPDNDPRGPWQSVSANVQAGHATPQQFYEIIAPNGNKHFPPNGRCWVYNKQKMQREIEQNNIWFGNSGNGVPRIKKFLKDKNGGLTPESLWLSDVAGTSKIAKKHLLNLFPGNPVFDTPKPEQLLKRIIQIATNEGDYVLDAFLGSGTTTATAHKMKRKYIGIEIENDIIDLAVSRMLKVIDGDRGGISEDLSWTGGGGFVFYDLYF